MNYGLINQETSELNYIDYLNQLLSSMAYFLSIVGHPISDTNCEGRSHVCADYAGFNLTSRLARIYSTRSVRFSRKASTC
jgi:hypothetical protein